MNSLLREVIPLALAAAISPVIFLLQLNTLTGKRPMARGSALTAGAAIVLMTGAWRLAPGPNRPELTDPRELPGRREAPVVSTGRSALIWGGGVASTESDDGSISAVGCCGAVGEGALFTPPVAVAAPAGTTTRSSGRHRAA